jgi:hypothetical protein
MQFGGFQVNFNSRLHRKMKMKFLSILCFASKHYLLNRETQTLIHCFWCGKQKENDIIWQQHKTLHTYIHKRMATIFCLFAHPINGILEGWTTKECGCIYASVVCTVHLYTHVCLWDEMWCTYNRTKTKKAVEP